MSYSYLIVTNDPIINAGYPLVIESHVDKAFMIKISELLPHMRFIVTAFKELKVPQLSELEEEYMSKFKSLGIKVLLCYNEFNNQQVMKDLVAKLCNNNKELQTEFMKNYKGEFKVLDKDSKTDEWMWDHKNQYYTKKLPVSQIVTQQEYIVSLDKKCRSYIKSRTERCPHNRAKGSLYCKTHSKKQQKDTWNLPLLDPFHICRCSGCTKNPDFMEEKTNGHHTECWCQLCVCESRRIAGRYSDKLEIANYKCICSGPCKCRTFVRIA